MSDESWLAAHLYYDEPQTEFLERGVYPFVQEAMSKYGIKKYFFVRYFDRGYHIRLRLNGRSDTLEAIIKPYLINYFANYFHHYPSERIEPDEMKFSPNDEQWYTNN